MTCNRIRAPQRSGVGTVARGKDETTTSWFLYWESTECDDTGNRNGCRHHDETLSILTSGRLLVKTVGERKGQAGSAAEQAPTERASDEGVSARLLLHGRGQRRAAAAAHSVVHPRHGQTIPFLA